MKIFDGKQFYFPSVISKIYLRQNFVQIQNMVELHPIGDAIGEVICVSAK